MMVKLENAYDYFESCTDTLIVFNSQILPKDRVDLQKACAAMDGIYFVMKAYESSLKEHGVSHTTVQVDDHKQVRLPVISVPMFSGDIVEFPSWKSLHNMMR